MAPMVSIRLGPTAAAVAAVAAARCFRGECIARGTLRALGTRRNIATGAVDGERGVESPGAAVVPPPPPPPVSRSLQERREAIRTAKPFSEFLTDSFARQHDYLRISITERCNLRCLYCMPEEGVPLSPPAHMLTTPEIFYLSSLFVSQGVTKIRLTGGEPTVRRDILPLMQRIGSLRSNGLRELALTTNGISLHRKLDAMVEAGLTGVNLSLDTLDPFQFQIMTRRKGFEAVMKSIDRILEMKKLGANIKLKVNCVVMRGLNERDIIPFVELGRDKDIEVRFIEYMPFGGNKWSQGKMISFQEMLDIIRAKYPHLRSVPGHKNDTSKTYEVPGFVGKVGFITSMTNDFCGTCNRLRITSDGNLKVCLHGNDEVSLRDLLRQDNNGEPIDQEAFERIKQIEMDRRDGLLSDKTILGWGQREQELLQVIGTAVKRKAEKHADMGDLKNMTNRPMILIDHPSQHLTRCQNPVNAVPRRTSRRPISSAGPILVQPWSIISSPRPPFIYPSLTARSCDIRAFSTTCHLPKDISLAKAVRGIKDIDEKVKAMDALRWKEEQIMLETLQGQGKTSAENSRESRYNEYWMLLREIEDPNSSRRLHKKHLLAGAEKLLRLIHKDRSISSNLERAHPEALITKDLEIIRQERLSTTKSGVATKVLSIPRTGTSLNYSTSDSINDLMAPSEKHLQRLVSTQSLEGKILELETRINTEKRFPPTLEPPDFQEFRKDNVTGMTHATSRFLWRRRKAYAQKLKEHKAKEEDLQKQWRQEMDEMENTLELFKAHLIRLMSRTREQDGKVDALMAKRKEIMEKRGDLESRQMKQGSKRKIASVEAKVEVSVPGNALRAGQSSQLSEAGALKRYPFNAAEIRQSTSNGDKPGNDDDSPLAQLKARRDALLERREAKKRAIQSASAAEREPLGAKTEVAMRKLLDARKMKDSEPREAISDSSKMMDNRQPGSAFTATEESQDNHANERSSVPPNSESLRPQDFIDTVASSLEGLKARRDALAKEREAKVLQLQAHKIPGNSTNPELELENLVPESKGELSAEDKLQQLRDISQSIAFLRKFSSKAQPSDRSSATADRVAAMLEELQNQTLFDSSVSSQEGRPPIHEEVKDERDANPDDADTNRPLQIRKTNDNPNWTYRENAPKNLTSLAKGEKDFEDAVEHGKVLSVIREHNRLARSAPEETEEAVAYGYKHEAEEAAKVLRQTLKENAGPEDASKDNGSPKAAPEKLSNVFGAGFRPEPPRPSWPEPQAQPAMASVTPQRALSDSFRGHIPPSGFVQIDSGLTVNIEAPTPDLQSQIYQIRERLRTAYPGIDTLPYDVWTSSNRQTLTTWLRILVNKWQTRFDNAAPRQAKVDTYLGSGKVWDGVEVQSVLDQMVRNHDLSREAAERMARRWVEVFDKRRVLEPERDVQEEDLDWDEWDTGLGWLRDDVEAEPKAKEKEQNASEGPPKAAERKESDQRRDDRTSYVLPEDLPFTWNSKKGNGFRRAAVGATSSTSTDMYSMVARRGYSTSSKPSPTSPSSTPAITKIESTSTAGPSLPHLTSTGTPHMVSVSGKAQTLRTAIATGTIHFGNPMPFKLIRSNSLEKGDVLSVSRIAGIMAAKRCPDFVPLCHPIMLTHVGVKLALFRGSEGDDGKRGFGGVVVEAKVQCEGQTGVEMEALTSVMGAALSVVDMCKAVDKAMVISDVRVVLKEGGRSGKWEEPGWKSVEEGGV